MSIAPSIRLIAFEQRTGYFIFVAVPDERGRYLRTDRSVVICGCPMCHSIKGEPCRGRDGYGGTTHTARRVAAASVKGRQDDLIEPVDLHEPGLPPQPAAQPAFDIEVRVHRRMPLQLLDEPRPLA